MKYFNGIDTLDQLKSEYRRLAMENHPDRGGDVAVMQEVNAEFDLAFRILGKKSSHTVTGMNEETAFEFRRSFYTENGWAGSRYNSRLSLRDIAPIVRGYVKDVYPTWKFSVTREYYSVGCKLHVCLTQAPANIFSENGIKAAAIKGKSAEYGYLQNWPWYYEWMTDTARSVLEDVQNLVESYRFSDCDGRFDYYDTNFWTDYYIGKWNKPLKIVQKQERIQTAHGPDKARRITS